MKVRVRRPYLGAEGKTHRGQELEMSEDRFRQLTTGMHSVNPLVDPVEIGYKMQERAPNNKMEPAPKNKRITLNPKLVAEGLSRGVAEAAEKTMMTPTRQTRRTVNLDGTEAAKTGAADPSNSPPTGGQTGAETAASSSAQDQAPPKRKYTRRKAKHE